jgi:uncharacterized protein (DUF2062 family)
MIHLGKRVVRKWLEALLHIHDSPQRTAAAYALGVFFGFSPFLGLHTLLGLLLAFVLRLNRVAVLLGVYSNLPWIIAPYYTLVTVAGARLLGVPLPAGFGRHLAHLFDQSFFDMAFWSRLENLVHPLLWPYAVGSMLGAVAASAIAYWVALAIVVEGRKHVHLRSHASSHKDGT